MSYFVSWKYHLLTSQMPWDHPLP